MSVETSSVSIGKERALSMFENRMVRTIFGPKSKRDDVRGGWRKIHSEGFS
jgi:hypothetical protein